MNTPGNFGQPSASYFPVGTSAGTSSATTITTLVKTGMGRFCGMMISKAPTASTITVYDSITASGTAIFAEFTPTAGILYRFDIPILFENGLHFDATGSVLGVVSYY